VKETKAKKPIAINMIPPTRNPRILNIFFLILFGKNFNWYARVMSPDQQNLDFLIKNAVK